MAKFRKKPIVVDALQYNGENVVEIVFFGEAQIEHLHDADGEDRLVVPTLEGRMILSKGDWVIKGSNNEFYPCKPKVFEQVYEPA